MFEHKNLDGVWNRVLPASDSYLGNEILEMRDNIGADCKPESCARRQYSVYEGQLVERCLPPEQVGDRWSYDATGIAWWIRVNNPPHVGILADFNQYLGGKHRNPVDINRNVVAYAGAGEKIFLKGGEYVVTRSSDGKEIIAPDLIETRQSYYADA